MFLERFTRPKVQSPVGTYKVDIISLPEECDWEEQLPREIAFLFAKYPNYKVRIKEILEKGYAIGVRTMLRTPEHILKAVHVISVHSQRNYIVTWLPSLLRDKHYPVFAKEDYEHAKAHNEDLDSAVEAIVRDRLRFKRLVLIDEENPGINPEDQRFMTELTELMYPLQVDYSVHRVIADNATERTAIAQNIIKALLFVGPAAHILEKFMAGAGKVFAASADDLIGESAEIMALRGSGFTWKELAKRSRILIPVFILATYGAFQVHHLIESGRMLLGGAIFGLSAVALSLTTAIQSFFMYRINARKLLAEGKIKEGQDVSKLAFIQDFTNPARLGLIMGAGLAPVMGMLAALSGLMSNGWVLAAVGSTESIVAGLTVVLSGRINERLFQRKLRKLIKK